MLIVAAGILVLAVAAIAWGIVAMRRGIKRRVAEWRLRQEDEIAVIVEHSRLTLWGIIWTIGFILMTAAAIVGGSMAATVFQQIASGISWIAGAIIFAVAFLTCRRRTYTVYRSNNGYRSS
jgi:heme/copper-type cytochrome/quinol oxidase subunit 3